MRAVDLRQPEQPRSPASSATSRCRRSAVQPESGCRAARPSSIARGNTYNRASSRSSGATSKAVRVIERPEAHQLSRRGRYARRPEQRLLVRRLLSVRPDQLHAGLQERILDRPADSSSQRRERRSDRTVVPVGTPGSITVCRSVLDNATRTACPTTYFGTRPSERGQLPERLRRDPGQDLRADRQRQLHRPARRNGLSRLRGPKDGVGVNVGRRVPQGIARPEPGPGVPDRATSPARALRPFRSAATSRSASSSAKSRSRSSSTTSSTICRSAPAIVSRGTSSSNGRKYDTDTYKLSAEFAPIRDIRFRGSYNRAVRAPNIQELFAPQFVAPRRQRPIRARASSSRPTELRLSRPGPAAVGPIDRLRPTRPPSITACSAATRT